MMHTEASFLLRSRCPKAQTAFRLSNQQPKEELPSTRPGKRDPAYRVPDTGSKYRAQSIAGRTSGQSGAFSSAMRLFIRS